MAAAGAVMLYVACAATVPFYTRGEPREALAVRAMLAGGDVLLPWRQPGELARKPPFYHWLAGAVLAAGVRPDELALRLPSIGAAAAGVAMVAGVAAQRGGWGAAALAAAVLATSLEWMRAATTARVDMTLAAAVTAATLLWWRAANAPSPAPLVRAGSLAAAAAVLTKGPVGALLPVLVLLADAVLSRRPRARLRPLLDPWAAGLLVVPPLAWYAAALVRGGAAFAHTHVLEENVFRFLGVGHVPHVHSALYYPPVLAGGLLPWTPAVVLGVVDAWRRREPLDRFLLAWAAVVVAFYTLAAGKRSVYLLPAYPPLAVLAGMGLAQRLAARPARWWPWVAAVPAVLALAVALGAVEPVLAAVRPLFESDADRLDRVRELIASKRGTIAGALAGFAVLGAAGVGGPGPRARIGSLAAAAVVWALALSRLGTLPLAQRLTPAPFAARVTALVPPQAPLCALGGVSEGVRWYVARDLPPCRLRCEDTTGHGWVLRMATYDPDRKAACLRTRLRGGPGAGVVLEEVVPLSAGSRAVPREQRGGD
jgi:4-amino-4-deoxy-L-arabinose transferase-like glycosyltransferase